MRWAAVGVLAVAVGGLIWSWQRAARLWKRQDRYERENPYS